MSNLIKTDKSYAEWIKSLSLRFRQSQIKAAVKVNSELIRFYWELGRDMMELKAEERWKENFWENLNHDLQTALPGVKGFSITNLQYTRRFYLLYSMTTNEVGEVPQWIGPSSGWGYNKKDALIMACENSSEGIHNEYVFAEARSKIEVQEVLRMYYADFKRLSQRLVMDSPNHRYDVINIKVYLFSEEDWNFLKNDYESHGEYKNDEAGLRIHLQLRNQRIEYYISE